MIAVTFNQEELNALAALFDVAVKASGLQAAKMALPIMAKLEEAVAAVNASRSEESE